MGREWFWGLKKYNKNMFENLTIIFAFSAMIAWGVGDFLIQKSVRKLGNFGALIWINFIAGVGLIPFVYQDFYLINYGKNIIGILILALISFFFGVVLLKAYEQGKLSVVDVLVVFELPLTIILGLTFFKEKISWLQALLILIIIAGIFLVSKKHQSLFKGLVESFGGKMSFFEKGAILALSAALLSAFNNFFITVNSRNITPVIAIWLPWVISLFFLLFYVYYKKGLGVFWAESMKYKKLIIWTGIIDASAWVFYSLSLKEGALSITTAITESYLVISIFLGVHFNKEKLSVSQYFGAAIAFIGSIILGSVS
jgi:drug/metabolite transporter (DMT)-like permease